MEDSLTLTNDAAILIINELNYKDTQRWCQTSQQFRQKCNLDYWSNQIRAEFDLTIEQENDLMNHKPVDVTKAVYYKWLKMWLSKMSENNFIISASQGLLPVVKLYYYKGVNSDNNKAFQTAVEKGHLDVTQWLYSLGGVDIHADNDRAFRYAAMDGHLDMAKWLYSLGGVDIHADNNFAFEYAAINGHLDVAKWLYSLGGVDIQANAIRRAAMVGHLDMTKWLYSLGGVDIRTLKEMKSDYYVSKHKDVVEWLNSLIQKWEQEEQMH